MDESSAKLILRILRRLAAGQRVWLILTDEVKVL